MDCWDQCKTKQIYRKMAAEQPALKGRKLSQNLGNARIPLSMLHPSLLTLLFKKSMMYSHAVASLPKRLTEASLA